MKFNANMHRAISACSVQSRVSVERCITNHTLIIVVMAVVALVERHLWLINYVFPVVMNMIIDQKYTYHSARVVTEEAIRNKSIQYKRYEEDEQYECNKKKTDTIDALG